MARTLYFDCFSGISGDMLIRALLDLGLPLDDLRAALGSLAIDYGTVSADRVLRAGVSATHFRVHAHEKVAGQAAARATRTGDVHTHADDPHHQHAGDHDHPHDHGHAPQAAGHGHDVAGHQHGPRAGHGHHSLADIRRSIDRSALSAEGKARAIGLFRRLAEAEAAIHGIPVDRVHLHEVGAVDSIIDIVGAVFGMEWLGASTIVASPVNVGGGTVRCAHGVFPVPAPATARLLQGVPVYAGAVTRELTTPTGALLVTEYAQRYGPLPPMAVTAIGYGAGTADVDGHPNVLRLMVGREDPDAALERIVTIECEIDDMNPQLFGPLMDRLYGAGALDVFYAPVQMKKNRPGTLVTVLAPPHRRDDLVAVLFVETTTIGVRYLEMQRERLERETISVQTAIGAVRMKVARRQGKVMNASPEFDDCARLAAERGLPVKDVQALAIKAWLERR